MKWTRHLLTLWLGCALLLTSAGCGPSSDPARGGGAGGAGGATTATATQDATGIKHYAPEKLPAVDYNIPPQDEGRLEVPTPPGWFAGSRQSAVLIWFYEKDKAGLPRIVITGEPCQREGINTITKANVLDFAKTVSTELEAKEQEVLEEPRAVMLGDNAWVRYVLLGKYKNTPVDRQILRTVVDGREYVVDLQVLRETVMKHRDSAYAIAAGIKFHPAGTAAIPPESAPDSLPPETAEPNKATDPTK